MLFIDYAASIDKPLSFLYGHEFNEWQAFLNHYLSHLCQNKDFYMARLSLLIYVEYHLLT